MDWTWTGFEFSRQEKSHVMGRVPDVSRPLGLIFLLDSKKGSCTGCVPAFGPNGVGRSQKSWPRRSSTGREPLSLCNNFENHAKFMSLCRLADVNRHKLLLVISKHNV